MTVIAEHSLDISGAHEKVVVRVYAPRQHDGAGTWICRFEIMGGIETLLDVQGETSLQALSLALKGLAAVLYGSDLYRSGRLGFFGDFSGYLGVPAPNVFLEEAPYPF